MFLGLGLNAGFGLGAYGAPVSGAGAYGAAPALGAGAYGAAPALGAYGAPALAYAPVSFGTGFGAHAGFGAQAGMGFGPHGAGYGMSPYQLPGYHGYTGYPGAYPGYGYPTGTYQPSGFRYSNDVDELASNVVSDPVAEVDTSALADIPNALV
jgi:hypothetical protein